MNTTLKILVVDDTECHRRAAKILLADHDLTIVGSYDEGAKALRTGTDYDRLKELRKETGFAWASKDASEEEKEEVRRKDDMLTKQAFHTPDFDVVLLDLLMPASRNAQGDKGMQFVGKEMPVGTFLILLAIVAGVKNIAMVTDKNHHHHPASAALDPINRTVIKVGDTRIYATNCPDSRYFDAETGEFLSYDFLNSEEGKAKYPRSENWGEYRGTFSGKSWDSILKTLLGNEKEVL